MANERKALIRASTGLEIDYSCCDNPRRWLGADYLYSVTGIREVIVPVPCCSRVVFGEMCSVCGNCKEFLLYLYRCRCETGTCRRPDPGGYWEMGEQQALCAG